MARKLLGVIAIIGLITTSLIAVTTGTALACSCGEFTNLLSIDVDDPILTARVIAVDRGDELAGGTDSYTLDVLVDPNDRFDTDTVAVQSSSSGAACGVVWSDGDLVGITLATSQQGGAGEAEYTANTCDTVAPEVVELYDDYVQRGADPGDFCRDALTAERVPLSEARLILNACNQAQTESGSFVVIIDDEYFSRPVDELVSITVAELGVPTFVTLTPSSTAVPAAMAPTPTPVPAAITVRTAPTATPMPLPVAPVAVAVTVGAAAPAVSTGASPATSALTAADFGWTPAASSSQHVAAVERSGAKVVAVGFTG